MSLSFSPTPGQVEIKLDQATFSRPNQNLFSKINWHWQAGEQWAIYGPVGAGKTTLLRALLGQFILSSGTFEVKLWDEQAAAFRPCDHATWRRQITLVSFQPENTFYDYNRAFYQQRYQSLTSEWAVPTVREVLQSASQIPAVETQRIADLLQLTDLLPREVIKLSNGQTRKLQIARALLQRPRLLLLDNPFAGLDATAREHLKEIIDTLIGHGTQVLLATNQPELPAKITHVLHLENFAIKGTYSRPDFLATFSPADAPTNNAPENILPLPSLLAGNKPTFAVAVQLKDVNVRYAGTHVLQNVSWTVQRGEKWALVGPNGSGKSTLLSLIYADNPQAFANNLTLFDRRKGSGESIWDLKKRMGFVSPELHVYFRPLFTGAEVVATGFTDTFTRPARLSAAQQELIHQHFAYFGRPDWATQSFRQLSAGEQRLVLLIRSLIKNPELIIWDEPFQGLSPAYIARATALLAHYCTPDTTLIFVSHYASEIPTFVGNCLALEAGRIKSIVRA